jgi:hypothetical protein
MVSGYDYFDRMNLLLPPAPGQLPFGLINPPRTPSSNQTTPSQANQQQIQKPLQPSLSSAPLASSASNSSLSKYPNVKSNKKQIAKEYEQQQQLQAQQQQQQQVQVQTPSVAQQNQLPNFSQFQPAQPQASSSPYANYYSALNDLGRFPSLLFAAAAVHNNFPDLNGQSTQPAQQAPPAQTAQSQSQNNFLTKQNPLDLMNQVMMSNFSKVYTDNRQPSQFTSFFNQYPTYQAPPAAQEVKPEVQTESYYTGYTEFQDRSRMIWNGAFTIKNDTASIGMNFASGNMDIAKSCLSQMTMESNNMPLRILQRMRLEQSQLEGVQRKLQLEHEHCVLIAVPYGANPLEQLKQTSNLRNGFINYLLEKKAAGIINVNVPNVSFISSTYIKDSYSKVRNI